MVSDELVLKMVGQRLESSKGRGFLLDGFPRNVTQAEKLDHMLDERGQVCGRSLTLSQ